MEEAITSDQPISSGDAKPIEDTSTKGEEVDTEATTSDNDEVVRLKKENEQLKKLQGQADRKARQERLARRRLEQRIKFDSTGEPSSTESEEEPLVGDTNQEVERAKAESQMVRLAYSNENYRKILDSDPTLRRIVESNPLALVQNPIDAEDAVMQLQEILDNRADEISQSSSLVKEVPKVEKETTAKETPERPKLGAVNPNEVPSEKYEEDLKKGDIEGAVWGKMNDKNAWNK